MRLLVLGGTMFVGRAVVTAAVDRGWSVTTFNRGRGTWAHPGVERVTGDRLRGSDLAPLAAGPWDAVVDTWWGAPRVVRDSARLLATGAAKYLYVSSRSVYTDPTPAGMDESWTAVEASPDDEATAYPQDKRGAEMAVEAAFGTRAVLARAGLILGPHEDVGRLPWWLTRIDRGGEVLAPGPADQPLRYVDVRDLAAWLLNAAQRDVSGPVNIVNPAGHATMRLMLEAAVTVTGGDARLTWVDAEVVRGAGIHRWTELPCWLPPDADVAGLIWTDVERARATGLQCRPVEETVADTWSWMAESAWVMPANPRGERLGLDPARESAVLEAVRRGTENGTTQTAQ